MLPPRNKVAAVGLGATVTRQLGHPSGRVGRLLVRGLNRANHALNEGAVGALAPRAGEHVADLGFGGGVGLELLLATPAARVVGIERSADALAVVRDRCAEALTSGRLELHEGELPRLPLADGALDGIITVNTIYFWPGEQEGLGELRRVLKPGGRLVIGVRLPDRSDRALARHGFRSYTGEALVDALRAAGFTDVRVLRHGRMGVVGVGVAPATG